eukprot:11771836-Alexandrium_andersonii.AAC.1
MWLGAASCVDRAGAALTTDLPAVLSGQGPADPGMAPPTRAGGCSRGESGVVGAPTGRAMR